MLKTPEPRTQKEIIILRESYKRNSFLRQRFRLSKMYAKMAWRKFIRRSRVIFIRHYIICTTIFYVHCSYIIHLHNIDFKISRQMTGSGCSAAYYLPKAACEYVKCRNYTCAAYFVYDFINLFCYLSVFICSKSVGKSTIILIWVNFIITLLMY